ncbi:MAG: glycosyl hydrolase family 28-related protein [Chthoniobacterales bacterium]
MESLLDGKVMAFGFTSRCVEVASRRFGLLASLTILWFSFALQSGYAQKADQETAIGPKTPNADRINPVEVTVKSFGAAGDGITNDTAAFAAALKSVAARGGGVCRVPPGTYRISSSGITPPFIPAVSSGVHLVGAGRGQSILKINGMPTNQMLQCDGDNWSVEDLTFDMQDYFPRHLVSAVTCKGRNWRVTDCDFINIGRFGISAFGGDNWQIERNNFTKTNPIGDGNEAINVSRNRSGTPYATNARIVDNVCDGSGIWFWGNHSLIARNRVSRTGFGTGIGTGTAEHAGDLEITGNICSGGRGFDQNRTWVSGFELWAPNSTISNNIAYDNDGSGIIVGGRNCIVIGNHSFDNGAGSAGVGFGARYLNALNNASGSVFIDNVAHDAKGAARSLTQTYGYAEQPGGLRGITQIANDYGGNKIGDFKINHLSGSGNISTSRPTYTTGGQTSAFRSKLRALAAARNAGISEGARRAISQYLAR